MIQKIELRRGTILTRNEIIDILNKARSTFQYAKFSFSGNRYIKVYYDRDRTVDIATNVRDFTIWNKIQIVRTSPTQSRIADFIFNSINILNK